MREMKVCEIKNSSSARVIGQFNVTLEILP